MSQCRCSEFLSVPRTWADVEVRFLAGSIIRPFLDRIAYHPMTGMHVSRCHVCGRMWAGEYPMGELQGGGPELLYVIDERVPAAWLAHATPLGAPLRRAYQDRGWFESLPPEIGPERCREPGCTRLRTNPGLFCRCHHFEMVMRRPCPVWDRDAGTLWVHVSTVPEGQPAVVDGVDVWKHEWRRRGDVAVVKDPAYGQTFRFPVYEILASGQTVSFAAGEFSNGAFGVYRERARDGS
jgi:hypothetical protein